jgi:acyl-CoA synthetase (AMP-forming)/AMP-acid ligase II
VKLGSIERRAAADPDGIALSDDERALTWRELGAELRATGALLSRLAGEPDQRVGVLGENRVETVIAHGAGILTGIGTVALSRQLTAAELADQLQDAGATAVVTGPSSVGAVEQAADRSGVTVIAHGIATVPPGWTAWAAMASQAQPATGDDPAAGRAPRPPIVYTSGTTGRARGTEVRWLPRRFASASDYAQALGEARSFPPGPHLVVGPLQHNGPLTSLRHLVAGQPVVVLGSFDAERVLQLVERHGVTSTVMVPTHFRRLLDLPESVRARYDVSSLVSVAHTGSACPADVKRAMIAWWGPVLVESYGGSEIGTVCRIGATEWLERPGSVGRCVPPFEAVVLDETGDELPVGEVGVLGFRSPDEYAVRFHADPEKTAKAYIAPGVASLGDVGYVDSEGYVYVTDRVSDMVISGGVNLYPAEIERVLEQHPGVAESAVIGVPNRDLGETLLALVVPAGEPPDEADLVIYLKRSLAGYKVPRSFRFVSELERNAMGKIDKRRLRAHHSEEMSST